MILTPKSQASLIKYAHAVCDFSRNQEDERQNMEIIDREYFRTSFRDAESEAKRRSNNYNKKKVLDDVTVPVIYPQVDAMTSYLCGVFLSGYPIFAAVAAPEHAEAVRMMDAVNSSHQIKGKWIPNLAKAFRAGLKYNRMAVEVFWEKKKEISLKSTPEGYRPQNTTWEGNVIRYHQMYNTFRDPRVELSDMHTDGEFCGYVEVFSKVKCKTFLENLDQQYRMRNFRDALESGSARQFHYVPNITNKVAFNASSTELPLAATWLSDGMPKTKSKPIQYKNIYEVTTLYARIIPEEHGIEVPQSSTPQIWKLIYVNNAVLVYAEKLSNGHGYFPMIFGAPMEDGLGEQTLSFAEQLLETQSMSSALWNIKLNSARRNVSDRGIYNPEYIREEDINSSNPSAKIALRRNKYLDDIRKAYFPIPYDGTAANAVMQDAALVQEMGRSISGISKPFEGQFIKGNRTLGEYEDIRGNADARSQMIALQLQAQFIAPIKEILLSNVLQYVQAGSVYYSKSQQEIPINPQTMQNASLDFKFSDGLLPTNKIVDINFLSQLMNNITTVPEIQQQFDVVKVLAYIGALGNAPDLESFRRTAIPSNTPTPNPAAAADAATSTQPTQIG